MPYDRQPCEHPDPAEVALLAYLIWEREGRPQGRAKEHWLQAETQILACRAHEHWTGSREGSE